MCVSGKINMGVFGLFCSKAHIHLFYGIGCSYYSLLCSRADRVGALCIYGCRPMPNPRPRMEEHSKLKISKKEAVTQDQIYRSKVKGRLTP